MSSHRAAAPPPRPATGAAGQRAGLVPRAIYPMFVVAMVVGLGAVFVVAVMVGSVTVPPGQVLRVIGDRLGVADASSLDPSVAQVVWDLRVPRVLLAVVVGAGLSVAGTVIQVAVRNPLGDPYILGVMAGASAGAVSVIVLGSVAVAGLSVNAAAFAGALLATAATFVMGRRGSRLPPTRVVLAGVAIAYLFSSVTFYLQSLATPNELRRVVFWGLGVSRGRSGRTSASRRWWSWR